MWLHDRAAVVAAVRAGHVRTAARLLRAIEDGVDGANQIVAALADRTQRAHLVGITGPAGVGKSTLVSALVGLLRTRGDKVAVLAVDPSSRRTGGALLGDRVRMSQHAMDPGVFIRSIGSRGATGGLGHATLAMVTVLEAMGHRTVLIETLGAGQAEVEVTHVADTTVVVAMPGAGDDVQAMKSGLFEEADIFVVNKSDLPAAHRTAAQLRAAARLTCRHRTWRVPVLRTEALNGKGMGRLLTAIDAHHAQIPADEVRSGRISRLIIDEAKRWLETTLDERLENTSDGREIRELVATGDIDIETAVRRLIDDLANV